MEGADRISALPIELQITILSRLNVKDAVCTSVLSRSWRHLWTFLPCLHLSSFNYILGDVFPWPPVSSSWIDRAHHLVSSLRCPLLDFRLCHNFSAAQSALLQSLLDSLLQKGGVQTLHFFSYHDRVVLHLPSFHSLKELQLRKCHIVLPTGFKGFSRLATLTMSNVQISNDDLHLLIHTSNSLTTFCGCTFRATKIPLSVNFTSPFLRSLEFGIGKHVEKVLVVSAPCLDEAYIHAENSNFHISENLAQVFLGFMCSVASVSSLSLGNGVINSLSPAALPFNFSFPRLRCLKFSLNILTMDNRTYDVFIWLLRSTRSLEKLELELCDHNARTPEGKAILPCDELIKKQDGVACLDQTLRSVTFSMYRLDVIASIIGIIQFFLLNANVLKLMKITYWTGSQAEPSMIQELHKAKVTSSDAKLVIFRRTENVTVNVK